MCVQKLPSAFSFLVPFLHTEPSTGFMKNAQHRFQLAQLPSLVFAQHWIMPCRHTSWLAPNSVCFKAAEEHKLSSQTTRILQPSLEQVSQFKQL